MNKTRRTGEVSLLDIFSKKAKIVIKNDLGIEMSSKVNDIERERIRGLLFQHNDSPL